MFLQNYRKASPVDKCYVPCFGIIKQSLLALKPSGKQHPSGEQL